MVSVCLGDLNTSKMALWSNHPLGKGLTLKLLKQLESSKDLQQIAMVAALIFGKEWSIYKAQEEKQAQLLKELKRRQQIARLEKGNHVSTALLSADQKGAKNLQMQNIRKSGMPQSSS